MMLATPSHVDTWWTNGELFIHVVGTFPSGGHSINVFRSQPGQFELQEGYDGSPPDGNDHPYDVTVSFPMPTPIPSIVIIDANGPHELPFHRR